MGEGVTPSSLMPVRLGPLELKNPICTASGTFGYGLEFTDFVDLSSIGGLCTKGLSLKPHAGNAPPRICETPAGMLNSIGLQNVGLDAVIAELAPTWATWKETRSTRRHFATRMVESPLFSAPTIARRYCGISAG